MLLSRRSKYCSNYSLLVGRDVILKRWLVLTKYLECPRLWAFTQKWQIVSYILILLTWDRWVNVCVCLFVLPSTMRIQSNGSQFCLILESPGKISRITEAQTPPSPNEQEFLEGHLRKCIFKRSSRNFKTESWIFGTEQHSYCHLSEGISGSSFFTLLSEN